MAFTITDRHIQKIGRYSKEFIKIVDDGASSATFELNTRLNVPLFGVTYLNTDQVGASMHCVAFVGTAAAGTQNKAYYSNRASLAASIVIELTGY